MKGQTSHAGTPLSRCPQTSPARKALSTFGPNNISTCYWKKSITKPFRNDNEKAGLECFSASSSQSLLFSFSFCPSLSPIALTVGVKHLPCPFFPLPFSFRSSALFGKNSNTSIKLLSCAERWVHEEDAGHVCTPRSWRRRWRWRRWTKNGGCSDWIPSLTMLGSDELTRDIVLEWPSAEELEGTEGISNVRCRDGTYPGIGTHLDTRDIETSSTIFKISMFRLRVCVASASHFSSAPALERTMLRSTIRAC